MRPKNTLIILLIVLNLASCIPWRKSGPSANQQEAATVSAANRFLSLTANDQGTDPLLKGIAQFLQANPDAMDKIAALQTNQDFATFKYNIMTRILAGALQTRLAQLQSQLQTLLADPKATLPNGDPKAGTHSVNISVAVANILTYAVWIGVDAKSSWLVLEQTVDMLVPGIVVLRNRPSGALFWGFDFSKLPKQGGVSLGLAGGDATSPEAADTEIKLVMGNYLEAYAPKIGEKLATITIGSKLAQFIYQIRSKPLSDVAKDFFIIFQQSGLLNPDALSMKEIYLQALLRFVQTNPTANQALSEAATKEGKLPDAFFAERVQDCIKRGATVKFNDAEVDRVKKIIAKNLAGKAGGLDVPTLPSGDPAAAAAADVVTAASDSRRIFTVTNLQVPDEKQLAQRQAIARFAGWDLNTNLPGFLNDLSAAVVTEKYFQLRADGRELSTDEEIQSITKEEAAGITRLIQGAFQPPYPPPASPTGERATEAGRSGPNDIEVTVSGGNTAKAQLILRAQLTTDAANHNVQLALDKILKEKNENGDHIFNIKIGNSELTYSEIEALTASNINDRDVLFRKLWALFNSIELGTRAPPPPPIEALARLAFGAINTDWTTFSRALDQSHGMNLTIDNTLLDRLMVYTTQENLKTMLENATAAVIGRQPIDIIRDRGIEEILRTIPEISHESIRTLYATVVKWVREQPTPPDWWVEGEMRIPQNTEELRIFLTRCRPSLAEIISYLLAQHDLALDQHLQEPLTQIRTQIAALEGSLAPLTPEASGDIAARLKALEKQLVAVEDALRTATSTSASDVTGAGDDRLKAELEHLRAEILALRSTLTLPPDGNPSPDAGSPENAAAKPTAAPTTAIRSTAGHTAASVGPYAAGVVGVFATVLLLGIFNNHSNNVTPAQTLASDPGTAPAANFLWFLMSSPIGQDPKIGVSNADL